LSVGLAFLLYTLSLLQTRENNVRWLLLAQTAVWCVYDAVVGAWTPEITNTFFLVSTMIALWRYREKTGKKSLKKPQKKSKKTIKKARGNHKKYTELYSKKRE
jgi:hypothetical protein